MKKYVKCLSDESKFEIDLYGLLGNIRLRMGDLYIMPTREKLVIGAAKEDENIQKIIGKVALDIYKNLSHTPIRAIGNNFAFELDDKEQFAIDSSFSAIDSEEIYSKLGFTIRSEASLKHTVEDETKNLRLNVSYEYFKEKRRLILNYHYAVDGIKDKITFALDQYFDDYKKSLEVKDTLIKGI